MTFCYISLLALKGSIVLYAVMALYLLWFKNCFTLLKPGYQKYDL
ncbi:MAG: hypothetical protein K0R82_326 [Flavipsychrobacter sp.]|jgi:hypothetical protein|nr:hypothetical protein [Flavipsychrobacter sp.]